jgi:hypothetical protein
MYLVTIEFWSEKSLDYVLIYQHMPEKVEAGVVRRESIFLNYPASGKPRTDGLFQGSGKSAGAQSLRLAVVRTGLLSHYIVLLR